MQRVLILLITISTFFGCQKEEKQTSDSIHAIPIDAAVIVETNNITQSFKELSKSNLWVKLSSETSFKDQKENLFTIDSSLASYASHLTSVNPVFLSLHLTGAESFNWLMVSSTENQEQKIQLLELGLNNYASTKEHPYSEALIMEVENQASAVYYSIHQGLILISQEKVLVEDALRQLKTPNNLTLNNSFNTIYKSSNKKEDFNLYINGKNFDKISKSLLKKGSNCESQFEWTEWDIDILKNGVLLSGISLSHDSLSQELSFFEGNEGHELIAPSVLPKNTALFTSKCFENFKQYQRKQLNALVHNYQKNTFDKHLSGLDEINKIEFESWIDSEITWFLAENSNQLNPGFVIDLTNSGKVETYLQSNADSIVEYREIQLFTWDQLKYFSVLANNIVYDSLNYGCLLNEQLILTKDIALIKNIINDHKSEKQLANSKDYNNCMEQLNNKANFSIYIQSPAALQLANNYLHSTISTFLNQYSTELYPFRAFGLQFDASNDISYSNAYLHFDQSEADQTRAIWAKQLDAPILSEISLVKNHYNQKWEIAVQDENYNLYLISTEGEILWKRKLDGAIIGSVQQIDLYKNRKLQLLFNTQNRVHLIDRKGRDVGAYPILLKKETQLPLALFDYQKNREYRILLSCGKNHYLFNKRGEIIDGWKLKKTKSNVVHPAQHFVVAGNDYILLPEENGTLNILNRRGENRIKVKDKIEFSHNKLQVVKGNTLAETRIVTIDQNGIQQNILFDGSIDNSIQFEFDENIQFSYSREHRILVEAEDLKVNGSQMNLLHSFDTDKLTEANIYKSESQYYLSITDLKSSQAYLFRSPNDIVDGFPLYGTTSGILEDLDLDGKLNFIVGAESGIIYNYAAE
mgnify:FL=1